MSYKRGDTMEFISEINLFHLALISYTGALIGEISRSVECTKPISFTIFLTELLASGFLGVMIALALKGTLLKDKPVAVLSAAGVFGYLDRKACLAVIERLSFVNLDKKENKKR